METRDCSLQIDTSPQGQFGECRLESIPHNCFQIPPFHSSTFLDFEGKGDLAIPIEEISFFFAMDFSKSDLEGVDLETIMGILEIVLLRDRYCRFPLIFWTHNFSCFINQCVSRILFHMISNISPLSANLLDHPYQIVFFLHSLWNCKNYIV